MKHHIRDQAGNIIASNMDAECQNCLKTIAIGTKAKSKCSRFGGLRRIGTLVRKGVGTVGVCSPLEEDINSKRIFKQKQNAYVDVIPTLFEARREEISEAAVSQARRLIHNLTSLNALSIQHLYDFLPQDLLTNNLQQQLRLIENALNDDPHKAAKLFLRLAKNSVAMKSEFAVFKTLHEKGGKVGRFREHQLRKVLLNVLHPFFADFTDLDVHVKVADCSLYLPLDYETFSVAIYDIAENAVKYVMPHSELYIEFQCEGSRLAMTFSMLSLKILPEEVSKLCEEGFSGSVPESLSLAGQGIGMSRTKRLLGLNKATLRVTANSDPAAATTHNGMPYEKNEFTIEKHGAKKTRTN